MNDVERVILLQRLEKHLAYYKYDELGLTTLFKIRNEVHFEIKKLCGDHLK